MFLTADNLRELTGYRKPKLQRRWLAQNGYKFDVRGDGRPAVLVDQVNVRQLKGLDRSIETMEAPDFEALLN